MIVNKIMRRLNWLWQVVLYPVLVWVGAKLALLYRRIVAFLRLLIGPVARVVNRYFGKYIRFLRYHLLYRPNEYLKRRWEWYGRWYDWRHYRKAHAVLSTVFVITIGVASFLFYQRIFALPDLSDTWNFSTPSNYTFSSGTEASGSSARLKAQNYSNDANTQALYHLDDNTGSTATDSSSYLNDAAAAGSPTWVTGNLNYGLSLNGITQSLSAPDSTSLSLSGANTIEAWTKFSSSFSSNTHNQNQTILDKGSYKLYYDYTSGKIVYEMADSAASGWTQRYGDNLNGSWDSDPKDSVLSKVAVGTDIYVGLGSTEGDAEVWKWNGSTWTKIGGDSLNSSWNSTYETVSSLATDGTLLYAGLGSTTGDAEVWKCDTSSSCATWSQIPDGTGWNNLEYVHSLVYTGSNLYIGLGNNTAGDAEVWKYNGSTTTKIGGDGTGPPAALEGIYSLATDGTYVYAGTGDGASDAEVWRYAISGGTWTKIGGDSVNSGWTTGFNTVRSLSYYSSNLYAGIGDDAGEGEVWKWDGASWSQIGGDGLNSSWATTNYVVSLANDGTNLYAGAYTGVAGGGDIWKWNGSSWSQIGGDGLNSSWTNGINNASLLYANSTLYAESRNSANNAQVWTFNGSVWSLIGGQFINKSWSTTTGVITSTTTSGSKLYAAIEHSVIWEYNGSTWTIIGGQAINSSWAINACSVNKMTVYQDSLYVTLGGVAGCAEVWKWNGSSWSQIGGDGLNSSWADGTYEYAYQIVVYGTNLYTGLGSSADEAEVWKWNGSSWSQIGGDGLNSGWTGRAAVTTLITYNGNLYAGLGGGLGANEDEIWQYNGSSWSQIGGDGLNSSWGSSATSYIINSMAVYDGKLYVSRFDLATPAIWSYSNSTWSLSYASAYASDFAVYNGELYASTSALIKYDGASWSTVSGVSTNSDLVVYLGKLYANTTTNTVWSYGDNNILQSVATSQDTNWHHIAATYDGFTMKLYIDGSLNASTSATGAMPDNSRALLIGNDYGGSSWGRGNGFLAGSLDEIRISNTARSSFTSQPYSADPQTVTLNSAVRTSGVWHWDTFAGNETPNGGTVTYRLSNDSGTTWLYWDGDSWETSASTAQANSAAALSAQMSTFPVTVSGLKWQAILDGNGNQQVTLNSVSTEATSDTTVPATNASAITALKAAGGSSLAQDAWTNGSSPYFSWTAGTDTESGIKGYCLYLGTDNLANPVTTKGLLGNSPVATGGSCQFIIGANSIDLATAGYLGSALTSSSSKYYLLIKAIDNASNVYGSTASFSFYFDNTLPTNPAFITAPSSFVNTKTIALTWPTSGGNQASDTHSGLLGLQYRIGNTTWYGDLHTGSGDSNDILTNDGSYTTVDPPDFANLAEGVNTIYFRTWDQAGNVTTSYVTAALKINTTGAPTEPQNLTATPTTNTNNSFAFSWNAPASFVGNASTLTYCYTVNATPTANNCTFTAAGVTSLSAGPYATQPGSNTFYVVAKDESSNINYSAYASTTFTANTTAPGMPLNASLSDVSIRSTSSWRLAVNWDPPSSLGSGIASYKVYRSTDNVNFTNIGNTTSTSYTDTGLSQIPYYYKVSACDNTSNCGAYSSTVSDTPTGRFTSPPTLVSQPVVSNITTRRATISWGTDRTSDSRIAYGTSSGQYSPTEVAVSTQTTNHQVNLDNLSPGTTYYLIAKWTDEDGNTGTSQEFTLTTDGAPVVKEVTALKVGLTTATIQFTTKNATKVGLQYGKTDSFGGLKTINTSVEESTYSVELTGLSDGTKYFYRVVSYDSENFAYEGNVFSFTTPARPAITNLRFQPIEGEPTSTQRVTWQTNVLADSTVTYGLVNTNGTDTHISKMVTEHEIIIRGLEDNSEYFLLAQSRDTDGNLATSDKQIFKTDLDTRPPKITDVTVETTIRGTGAEARGQIVVSWKTDEPSTSQVAFGEGAAATVFSSRTTEDTALATEHVVIVSDLSTSRVYSVQPLSKDKAGNLGNGETQPAIIGRATDSVLTIILNTFKKILGF